MIKPQTSSLAYTRRVNALKSQTVARARLSRSDSISEVLAVCPQVSLLSCEVSSGRVNYSGKIIFTLLCCDDEGKLCRIQKGAEFSHYCDDENLAPAQSAQCALSCERVAVRRDGSAVSLSAVVRADIEVFAPAERTVVTSCEGAYLKTAPLAFLSHMTFSGECEVEDDFEADGVEDILVPSASVMVTYAECTAGGVEAGGEIILSLLAMRKGYPAGLERVIPFKCAIPCDEAVAGPLPQVRAEVRDMNVNATVDDEHGKCRITFTCTAALFGYFAQTVEQTVATDAFSCTHSLICTSECEPGEVICERKLCTERVSSPAATKAALDFTCRFLAVVLPAAEYEYSPESGSAEGSVNAVLLYEQGGEIKSAEISIPFSVRLPAPGACRADLSVCGVSVKQPTEGCIEGEAIIKICAAYSRDGEVRYLSAIAEGEPLPPEDAAITVVVPAAGDGLWDAAKKCGCPPEEVAQFNPDAKYPFAGGERVMVYRKK